MSAEEAMRRRVVLHSCLERDDGYPECMGAAAMGEHRCTCTLEPGEHDECVMVAWAHYHERGGKPCHDCAFRPGSGEMKRGLAQQIAEGDGDFFCHQGMPIDARGEPPVLGNYFVDDPRRYPPCAGLAAIRKLASKGRIG